MHDKKRCPKCGSGQVYIRISTGEIVCRMCGQITKPKAA